MNAITGNEADNDQQRLDEVIALDGRLRQQASLAKIKTTRKRALWLATIAIACFMKRALDIVGSFTMLVLLTPLFITLAACIWLTDRGPVLYWQNRVGQFGRMFPFPKFRSMLVNADAMKDKILAQNVHGDNRTFKMKNDPRITWIGKIIRKFSFDELPQFWCVLKGEMTLVGPRPPVPRAVALYSVQDRRRLEVRPGLTCIWQVSGRSDIPFEGQVLLDAQYIESQSIWLDLVLLAKTIPAVLIGKGAY